MRKKKEKTKEAWLMDKTFDGTNESVVCIGYSPF